jgi:hypothetical protein
MLCWQGLIATNMLFFDCLIIASLCGAFLFEVSYALNAIGDQSLTRHSVNNSIG